ncbi:MULTISPECIES: hypothetical protein [Idiomarina]|jgi:hypothetical protein|uniref:Uncharacterized protein n=1 Tax=Idiomarina baltica OS145 TaxID=314276 RepID=A0ABM9WQR0_9GAMM|nr:MULTISPECIES: hypothetical protein [Idiomarina]MAD53557.1 hypothetical protein [Idiomarinaceae bacterium]MEC7644351.1 hypothetical protein [Pseudomonadota bacterium]EAQ33181.1 hypothetical protein OS145_02395 [Idiomarina baltica OS145]KXS34969.1 MAG: Uncharacterized protein AWU56_1568 [Idiomarina sp. T82-3]MAF75454.1 hypothetical protein [Idiomarinaceae bacterium]|tara:strand:- start:5460 stop:5687 length:228 start_codon:yes stop_codon:yes gene_type:complete
MLLSLLLLQGLVAALLFYGLVGQYQSKPLWSLLAVLTAGFIPPLNWGLLLAAIGHRMWKRSPAMRQSIHEPQARM